MNFNLVTLSCFTVLVLIILRFIIEYLVVMVFYAIVIERSVII